VSRLQRLQRLWLRRLRRLRRLLSVLVVRRLLAGLTSWKEARKVSSDPLHFAFIDLANHVWFCKTADLERGEAGCDGGASGQHNREALGNGEPG